MLHLWSGSHLELRVLLEFHIHLQTHAFCSIVRQLQWLTELVPIEQQNKQANRHNRSSLRPANSYALYQT
jgi:hypothetical protein